MDHASTMSVSFLITTIILIHLLTLITEIIMATTIMGVMVELEMGLLEVRVHPTLIANLELRAIKKHAKSIGNRAHSHLHLCSMTGMSLRILMESQTETLFLIQTVVLKRS
jgi:hypothetical protein